MLYRLALVFALLLRPLIADLNAALDQKPLRPN
jgi:hypothetical protein